MSKSSCWFGLLGARIRIRHRAGTRIDRKTLRQRCWPYCATSDPWVCWSLVPNVEGTWSLCCPLFEKGLPNALQHCPYPNPEIGSPISFLTFHGHVNLLVIQQCEVDPLAWDPGELFDCRPLVQDCQTKRVKHTQWILDHLMPIDAGLVLEWMHFWLWARRDEWLFDQLSAVSARIFCAMRVFLRWVSRNLSWIVHSNFNIRWQILVIFSIQSTRSLNGPSWDTNLT